MRKVKGEDWRTETFLSAQLHEAHGHVKKARDMHLAIIADAKLEVYLRGKNL